MLTKEEDSESKKLNVSLLNYLIQHLKEERESSFRYDLAEDLGVSSEVISTILSLEHAKSLRKRYELLRELKETKDRVFHALLLASDKDELSVEDSLIFDPTVTLDELRSRMHGLVFTSRTSEEDKSSDREREQVQVKSYIQFHLSKCQANSKDMQNLIEWMAKFTFELTWEDIGMPPLEEREEEEEAMFGVMVRSLQRAWDCTKTLSELIVKLASDDDYDYMSGKVPAHILEITNRKIPPLWCSSKLRTKLKHFEKLRSKIKVDKKSQDKTAAERRITILPPGKKPKATPLKELEGSILHEISQSWKQASDDVAFYMNETMLHRFTKPSCRKRLKRALLLLEFVNAAIEGKIQDANRVLEELVEAQSILSRNQQESSRLVIELKDAQKQLDISRQNSNKLKKQVKNISKENEQLQMKKNENQNEIELLHQKLIEFRSRPTQEELEDCLSKIAALQRELSKFKEREMEMMDLLESKNKSYDELQNELTYKQSSQILLEEEIVSMSEQKRKAHRQIALLLEQLKKQGAKVVSAQRLMEDGELISTYHHEYEYESNLKQSKVDIKSRSSKRNLMPTKSEEFSEYLFQYQDPVLDISENVPDGDDDTPPIIRQEDDNLKLHRKSIIKDSTEEFVEKKTTTKAPIKTKRKQSIVSDKPTKKSLQTDSRAKVTKPSQEVTFAKQTTSQSEKKQEKPKKKKTPLNKHLNAFAKILTEEITEKFEEEYFEANTQEGLEAKHEFQSMIDSVKKAMFKTRETDIDAIQANVTSLKNTKETFSTNFERQELSTSKSDDVTGQKKSSGTEPELKPSPPHDDSFHVTFHDHKESNSSQNGSDAEDDKSFFKPSAGSKTFQESDNWITDEPNLKKEIAQKVARFGNRKISSSNGWYEAGRDSTLSALCLETSQIQLSPRAIRKLRVASLPQPITTINEEDDQSRGSSPEGDENSELPPEAEVFAKRISAMIHSYFSKLNKKLLDSLKRDKKKLEREVEIAKTAMLDEKLSSQTQIEKLKKDKEKIEKQLKDKLAAVKKPSKRLRSSLFGELPKAIQAYNKGKLRLIELSQGLSNSTQKQKQYSDNMQSQLEQTKAKMKESNHKIDKQSKEIERLRNKLLDVKQENVEKLFMSMGSHKFNCDAISERNDVDPDVKKVVLSLLKRSMMYPSHCFTQLVHRYAQKKEIESCITKVQNQVSDVIHLPPIHMSATKFSEKFNVEEKERLRHILSKLKSRCDVADVRWKTKMSELIGKRQKILSNLVLLFHKLTTEHSDISLIEPTIVIRPASTRPLERKKSKRLQEPRKNLNSPPSRMVETPMRIAPNPSFSSPVLSNHIQKTISKVNVGSPQQNMNRFAQLNERRLKNLNCPFRNKDGHTTLRQRFSQEQRAGEQFSARLPFLKWPVSDKNNGDTSGVIVPKLLQMDVQSGLRHARRLVIKRITDSYKSKQNQFHSSSMTLNRNAVQQQIPIFSSMWRETHFNNNKENATREDQEKLSKDYILSDGLAPAL